jgi:hypothetical protein
MHTASSAYLTNGMFLSASEKTATVFIPISRAVRITRIAISPRLAINIFCIQLAIILSDQSINEIICFCH